jgi:hypothetical protein
VKETGSEREDCGSEVGTAKTLSSGYCRSKYRVRVVEERLGTCLLEVDIYLVGKKFAGGVQSKKLVTVWRR